MLHYFHLCNDYEVHSEGGYSSIFKGLGQFQVQRTITSTLEFTRDSGLFIMNLRNR